MDFPVERDKAKGAAGILSRGVDYYRLNLELKLCYRHLAPLTSHLKI
jgi:hypothetical protein